MALRDALLAEYDFEAANTRKILERVPEDKFDWTPHPKSPTMGWLANHLTALLSMGAGILATDAIDITKMERPENVKTRQALLDRFDQHDAAFRAALGGTGDEYLMQPWSFRAGEKEIFTMPRIGALRMMVFNHTIHHRTQLGVYLRLNDIPLPSIYGPSADEGNLP